MAGHSRGAAVALSAGPNAVDALALLSPAGLTSVRPTMPMLRATLPWLIRRDAAGAGHSGCRGSQPRLGDLPQLSRGEEHVVAADYDRDALFPPALDDGVGIGIGCSGSRSRSPMSSWTSYDSRFRDSVLPRTRPVHRGLRRSAVIRCTGFSPADARPWRCPCTVTLRRGVRAGETEHATGGPGWWRCRRPGASRSWRWWCSRTTSRVGGSGRGVHARPGRARRAGWGGTPAALASHPTRRTATACWRPSASAAARADATIDQHQVQPTGGALLGEVLQHQLGRPVLVGRGRHHERAERQPGHVDCHEVGALERP